MRHAISIAILLCAFPLFPKAGHAQRRGEVKITTNVLSDRVALGEFGTLVYKVTGGDTEMPQRIEAAGLEVVHSGEQSQIQIANGVQMIEVTHFYRFRGSDPGTYTIPPITIRIGNQELASRPVEVTIFERDGSEAVDATRPYFAKLELPTGEFYVNEVIPFTLTAFARGSNSINDVVQPRFEHESFVIKNFRNVRTDVTEVGNTNYSTASLPSTLFALKPGEHRLGPATLGIRVLDTRSRGGFGFSSFFSRTTLQEMASNTVNVTVKPLPANAPASFTGGVGSFTLEATPSTTELSVGDPVSMQFTVSGTGNLRTMSAPVFSIPQTGIWKSYEPSKELPDDSESDGFGPGTATFSQVIIPETRVDKIPPFELSFFDPKKAEYVTLKTDPVPITVNADATSRPPVQAQVPGNAASSAGAELPDTPVPVASYEDMLHIRTGAPRWVAAAKPGGPGILFYLVQTLFSAAFFTVVAFGVVHWIRERDARREASEALLSFRESLKRIPRAGASKREFYHAIFTSLTLWKQEHPEAPPEVEDVIDRVSEQCESILYSGSIPADSPVTAAETSKFQSILEKLPRK